MITGELEYIHGLTAEDYPFDYFLGKWFGKKTEQEKKASKEKRSAFWENINKGYQQLGGAQGIIETTQGVKGVIKSFKAPSNVEVSMGHTKEEKATTEKGISKEVLIISAVAVFTVGVWGLSHYRKNKALKQLVMNK
ncbi:MAG: hypothetical protein CMD31_13085 [Flavobacteriales bacterium]|jgi:hypothetical protein|nr:hypothetical protein [Flavobacteriales bacterium]|tara:strand:- start:38255 stop:38665 length:411 start_codon:yes stop_codon:yes gene_type:complete